jgi:hypothetical protein
MVVTQEQSAALEAVRSGIAERRAPRPSSFVSAPLGVSADCISPADILDFVKTGIFGRQYSHVTSCSPCLETLTDLAEIQLQSEPDLVVYPADRARRSPGKHETTETPKTSLGLIAAPDQSVRVPVAAGVDFRCDVIPTFRIANPQQPFHGLTIAGALAGTGVVEGARDLSGDGQIDLVALRFPALHISPRVRTGLAAGQTVIDTVVVRGQVEGSDRGFAAQAQLTFIGA